MLISESRVQRVKPILAIISGATGRSPIANELETGVYEIGHFGCSNYLQGYDEYPDLGISPYGVCDNWEQIIEKAPEIKESKREFVITVTAIVKADEPSSGGWRWHKWGEYIGDKKPQYEYIHDEPDIDKVYCYHIYEKKAV